MCAVRVDDVNILDETDFFKDIPFALTLARAAVNAGEREGLSVLKKEHRGHGEHFVDFAGDVGERGARVGSPPQFDSEEEIGTVDVGVESVLCREGYGALGLLRDFVFGELEEKVAGIPF